jgi:hypothetical protein
MSSTTYALDGEIPRASSNVGNRRRILRHTNTSIPNRTERVGFRRRLASEHRKPTRSAHYSLLMSVKVDLDQLADTLAHYPFGYLITVGHDYQAHTVSIVPVLRDGVLDIGEVGNSTRRNICVHPNATLLWPPTERGGYSLIVDGRGELTDDSLRVIPHRAVLHRPAQPNIPTTSGCGDDCVPLT